MKTVFLLLLLVLTGGCASKQWATGLRHFTEGFQRAQERDSPILAIRMLLERSR